MKSLQTFLSLLVLLLVGSLTANAATIVVPDDYSTIQAAVTAANGGDVILVKNGTYTENVNIPGGKNGLIIKNFTGHSPVLDGSSVGNPKVAFRIQSDNVTIEGFTIQNYNYSGATNVAFGQTTRGVGIESLVASSQHTFKDNIITSCNWGIYVREGNNVTVQNNDINNAVATSFVGTWVQQGGVGIAFISGGNSMDNNTITNNTIDFNSNTANRGIVYGRLSGGNCGADFVSIINNTVKECSSTDFFAYGIYNILTGNAVNFSSNTSDQCTAGLDILSSTANDNDDVNISNNNFSATTGSIEVRSNTSYPGDKLWDIYKNNSNTFDEGTPTSTAGVIAAVEYSNDVVVEGFPTGYRYLRNQFASAVTDAQTYVNGAPTQVRVWVGNGRYSTNTPATINLITPTDQLLVQGESTTANLVSPSASSTILTITQGTVTVDPLTITLDVSTNPQTGISTSASDTYIHDVVFTSTGTSNTYIGIIVNEGAIGPTIENCSFNGRINNGIEIEGQHINTNRAIINCNTFNSTTNGRGIYVYDKNTGGEHITYVEIKNNTFSGNFINSILINLPTAASNNNLIQGNIFTTTNSSAIAVNIAGQPANNLITIKENNFGSYSTYTNWINNFPLNAVNAKFNYWDIPTLTPVPNVTQITGKFGGNVSIIAYLPIYTSNTDVNTACGFQPSNSFLWTPVYTTNNIGNDMLTGPNNEYFLTIRDALLSPNTSTVNNDVVYVTLDGSIYTYNENNPLVVNQQLFIGAAPVQASIPAVPTPKVQMSNNNIGFDLQEDNITLYRMEILQAAGSGTNDFPVYVQGSASTIAGITINSCLFNVNTSGGPSAAIRFIDGVHPGSNLIENCKFNYDNGNYAINFFTSSAAPSLLQNTDVYNNQFIWGGNSPDVAVLYGSTNNCYFHNNTLNGGIQFTVDDDNGGLGSTGNINIYNNTFYSSSTSPDFAIGFYEGVFHGATVINNIYIYQNKFQNYSRAISFNQFSTLTCTDYNVPTLQIYENWFKSIGANSIEFFATGCGSKLDARNNYWDSNYGPLADEAAPAWHDNAPGVIISNAYGYYYNQAHPSIAVPLQNATYIQYVPWWQDIDELVAGNGVVPGNFDGTSFSPITNNDAIPNNDDYASLIFAIDGTDDGGEIYMESVPDWNTPGQYVPYVETNTIENADKSLSIFGQILWTATPPYWANTTKITTVSNSISDNMFFFDGSVARTVNINYLNIVDLPSSLGGPEDIANGIYWGVNTSGTIDYCTIEGLSSGNITTGILLTHNTNNVDVTNSIIKNLDASNEVHGITIYLGDLLVDNVEIFGKNGSSNAIFIESGILSNQSFLPSNLVVRNSLIKNFKQTGTNEAYGILAASNFGIGTFDIYQNIIEDNQYGVRLGYSYILDDFSTAQIYNNIIRNNSIAGLYYYPSVPSTLTAENNYWGSDNGPRSENQIGGTQENTYNEVNQGNAVVDGNANSTIDYIPWRRFLSDDLTTKIAGFRFAPIVRTNAANLAIGLYANFTDAEAAASPTEKIYVYTGKYSEDFVVNGVNDIQFIGKYPATSYVPGWILAPNSAQFQNAWPGTLNRGAHASAPSIIYGGPPNTYLVDISADDISFKGFVFDSRAKSTPTNPYTGNPTRGIYSSSLNNNVTVEYNTFLTDGTDKAIDLGNGGDNDWTIQYNRNTSSTANTFVNVNSNVTVDNLTITQNDIDGGRIYFTNGAGDISDCNITYNEFKNTSGAILIDGTASAGDLDNLVVSNNKFYSTNTYALLISSTTPNGLVNNDWTSDVQFTNNYIEIPASTQIVVGFENPSASTIYSEEITATCNWWNGASGTPTGPTYAFNPGGNGARVSDQVLFTPWLASNANSATFGFTPTGACNQGIRVWVNTTGNPLTQTIVFPSLQMALNHPTVKSATNEYIFVADTYAPNVNENISIDLNAAVTDYLAAETASNTIIINGTVQISGTNQWDLELNSPVRVAGASNQLKLDNVGAQGRIKLNNNDLTVVGDITDASYGAIVTNGTGYLVKENVVTGGINRFPVINASLTTYTPAQFVINASGFTTAQNNILKVRVQNGNPPAVKGIGQDGYDVNNLWIVDWTNNGPSNEDFAAQFRFSNTILHDAGFVNTTGYAAYWDMNPVATQWTTKKSISSWNGSDGIQLTNLDLESGRTDWALFSGSTSFALSNEPIQAKNIQWLSGDDNTLTFQWLRNDPNAQYYAILAIQGSMTAAPSPTFTPTGICNIAFVNDPWTCQANDRNFSDGYVDSDKNGNWATSLYHNGAASPTDIRVVKIGQYTPSQTVGNVTVDNLAQGTYYTFFVANFNYGDGSTPISSMVTGVDGMANYNLNPGTTNNPRTRKTQPAVYMTLDVSSAFASNSSNQPNIVFGKTAPSTITDILTPAYRWRINGTLTGNTPVTNPNDNSILTGGYFAEFCNPSVFPANNVVLHFKGYGNNGGTNWNIKYSENSITQTFTTPLVTSSTNRTRNVATDYYLVSAYDGDGKVAKLYDNSKTVKLIFDQPTTTTSAIVGTHPTCAGNSLQITTSATSVPAATFVGFEVSTDGGTTWNPLSLSSTYTPTIGTNSGSINITSLSYADNGKKIRGVYTSNSVCDYPTLGATHYSPVQTLKIYDPTLTGTQPTPVNPYLCDDNGPITFTSTAGGPYPSPNNLLLQGWQIHDGSSWSGLITGATTYSAASVTSVTGVGTGSGTITITNANLNLIDNYQVRAVWQNGNCATTTTTPSTINIINKPVVAPLSTPAAKCIGQNITINSSSSAPNSGITQSIQWEISPNNITFSPLVTDANVSVSGETSANVTITPLTMVYDGYWVRVKYTHSQGGTDCITYSNSVQIDILPTPVFVAIPDQTVCENTNLTVTAVDANPVSWSGNVQWYYNTTPSMTGATLMTTGNTYNGSLVTISGTSDATFTINSTNLAWNGLYVLAYNSNGSCDGFEPFKVNVDQTPAITSETVTPDANSDLTSDEVCEGNSVTFQITYTPAATATVQWYYNNILITNGTSVAGGPTQNVATITTSSGTSTLVLSNVTLAIDLVNVFARVSNGVCTFVQSNNMKADIESIPVAPSTIGAQNIRAKRFDVTWNAVINADNYDIEVSDVADFSNIVASAIVTAPAVTWTGMGTCALNKATTYYFRVRANNQCGNGPWTTSNVVTLDPTVVSINWNTGFNGVFGNQVVGTQSAPQTYKITYYQLDAGLTLTIPSQFEARVGSNPWQPAGSFDLTPYLTLYLGTSGSPLTLDVDVRFAPTVCGVNQVDFVHTSNESCSGTTNLIENQINNGSNNDASGTGIVAPPTTNASNIVVLEPTPNTFNVTWTNGGGSDRLVIVTTSPTLSWTPSNNTTYSTSSSNLATATLLATNTWLVGVTPTSPLTITGLTAGQNYYIHIWEFNQCGANTEQYDSDYSTGLPYYLAFDSDETINPVIPDQLSGVSSTTTGGSNPLNVLVYLTERDGSPIAAPSNISVTIGRSPISGTFTTSPTSVTINSGSSSSNTFNFTWTVACGVDDGYLTATATNINGTQSNTFDLNVIAPTQQSRIIIWVGTPCAVSTTFKWTNGNGAGRIVVARENALPIAPTDGQSYTTNSDWSTKSSSNLLGSDTYVMGDLTGTSDQITITNLNIGQTYYFRVFEYNGCPLPLRKYNTNNATFNPRSRTMSCKEGNNLFDLVLDKFNVTSNKGLGNVTFNTLYEANISGYEIRRIDLDDANMNAVLVGSYMSNKELIAAGNTMTGKAYNFIDNSITLEVGKSYLYQLTAVAFDGSRIEVAEAEITISDDIYAGVSEFSVSPVNVNNNEVNFLVTVGETQNITIELFDVTGQKVSTIANDVRITRGVNEFKTNVANLVNGTYIIVVNGKEAAAVQKFQIVR
jgi:parallel beta-helix repeat protein